MRVQHLRTEEDIGTHGVYFLESLNRFLFRGCELLNDPGGLANVDDHGFVPFRHRFDDEAFEGLPCADQETKLGTLSIDNKYETSWEGIDRLSGSPFRRRGTARRRFGHVRSPVDDIEALDVLLNFVFKDFELVSREAAHRVSIRIEHENVDQNSANIGPEAGRLLLLKGSCRRCGQGRGGNQSRDGEAQVVHGGLSPVAAFVLQLGAIIDRQNPELRTQEWKKETASAFAKATADKPHVFRI